MALEFAGKSVLLVDGIHTVALENFMKSLTLYIRFDSTWHHVQRNRPNGQRCRRQQSHRCKLCTPYTVIVHIATFLLQLMIPF